MNDLEDLVSRLRDGAAFDIDDDVDLVDVNYVDWMGTLMEEAANAIDQAALRTAGQEDLADYCILLEKLIAEQLSPTAIQVFMDRELHDGPDYGDLTIAPR